MAAISNMKKQIQKDRRKKAQNPPCPRCGDSRTWKVGYRVYHVQGKGKVKHQAFKCSQCGFQFTTDKYVKATRNPPTKCLVCGKQEKNLRRGVCNTHYAHWMRIKKIFPKITPEDAAKIDRRFGKKHDKCIICGKEEPNLRKGMCNAHYQNWYNLRKQFPEITPEQAAILKKDKKWTN